MENVAKMANGREKRSDNNFYLPEINKHEEEWLRKVHPEWFEDGKTNSDNTGFDSIGILLKFFFVLLGGFVLFIVIFVIVKCCYTKEGTDTSTSRSRRPPRPPRRRNRTRNCSHRQCAINRYVNPSFHGCLQERNNARRRGNSVDQTDSSNVTHVEMNHLELPPGYDNSRSSSMQHLNETSSASDVQTASVNREEVDDPPPSYQEVMAQSFAAGMSMLVNSSASSRISSHGNRGRDTGSNHRQGADNSGDRDTTVGNSGRATGSDTRGGEGDGERGRGGDDSGGGGNNG